MTSTHRQTLLFALSAMCLVACAPVSSGKDQWAYVGRDESLRAPPRIARGDLSAAAWMAQMQTSQAAWFERREEAAELAKEACVRETGESKIPGFWLGYSNAFITCMLARGWTRGSNPL